MASTDLDRLSIDTMRVLSMDGSSGQQRPPGHADGDGAGRVPALHEVHGATTPPDPAWPDRDRFVLSAGHGSMLLYSVLHLTGYDLPLDELERFRQWGSMTPGHPERDLVHVTPGVETTTGPLGQGFGNGVGMAMAERFLRERYGPEVVDHRTFAICSDGDLMEGIAAEAASIAGHLGLGRMVYLFDDNHITIDGSTDKNYAGEDVEAASTPTAGTCSTSRTSTTSRRRSPSTRPGSTRRSARRSSACKSIIGWPAPTKQNTAGAHGCAARRGRGAR